MKKYLPTFHFHLRLTRYFCLHLSLFDDSPTRLAYEWIYFRLELGRWVFKKEVLDRYEDS